jgi:hypothetical protein
MISPRRGAHHCTFFEHVDVEGAIAQLCIKGPAKMGVYTTSVLKLSAGFFCSECINVIISMEAVFFQSNH